MTSLLSRFVRRRPKAPSIPVTVYTRQECCCCHKALEMLAKYQRKYNLAIDTVDIDGDPELVAAYGLLVPVVAIHGKVRFKGVVNPVLLERLLSHP
ncbi:MAG: hypothetical protein JWN86_3686 [Planctomycetota bacterium]|nr:hypothetical protein [Planctomycetota bacterium]